MRDVAAPGRTNGCRKGGARGKEAENGTNGPKEVLARAANTVAALTHYMPLVAAVPALGFVWWMWDQDGGNEENKTYEANVTNALSKGNIGNRASLTLRWDVMYAFAALSWAVLFYAALLVVRAACFLRRRALTYIGM